MATRVDLFNAGRPPGGTTPDNVLQAVANIVKYPSFSDRAQDPVLKLSMANPLYQPALAVPPTSWLLFLKITGGFYSQQDSTNLMDGPGNFAIDDQGYVYFDTNYIPEPIGTSACASNRAIKMTPWGENVAAESPFFNAGLSGQGFGVIFDPSNRLWIANFGFQDPPCDSTPMAATKNSVSVFTRDGKGLTPSTGYTQGGVSWPQGISSDRQGNIWIANCGNDSLTYYPQGDPSQARNIAIGAAPPHEHDPQIKPFGTVVDAQGNLWVTGNKSNAMYVFSPSGALIDTLPGTYEGRTVIAKPIGNTIDSKGNVWVANSDWLDVPCPTRSDLGNWTSASLTMYRASDRKPQAGSPFTGGGITVPWGVTVDGDDTAWVLNFGFQPPGPPYTLGPNGVSRLCGADTTKCPPGMKTGDPISPSTGYRSNALERMTAGAVDPSGNLWVTNNWKINVDPFQNPGGNAVVILIGAAPPLKTPVIGPPVPY